MKKALLIAASAFAALALSGPVSAETVDIGGTVPTQCAIDPGSSSIDFGTLSNNGAAAQQSNNYDLYCNVPFTLSIKSLHGRLIHSTANPALIGPEPGPGNYDGSSDFFAALDYTIDGISTADLDANVDFLIPIVSPPASNSASLTFETVPLASGNLVAGNYEDTFTLTLTPQGL
ncbi:MAG: hypothetical protein NVV62_07845 [Terricaulis sp.]|nr:hypothetical protein [Terricaulis sp.]